MIDRPFGGALRDHVPSQTAGAVTEISVLFPVHNEAGNLRSLVEEIHSVLRRLSVPYEIVAVDDGSTDGSQEVLLGLAREDASLRVACLRRNYGQSAALDAGFRLVSGDIIVTLDADLQNDPADIPRLIERLREDDLDFVAGHRVNRRDAFLPRTVPSRIANYLIRRVTGTRIKDLGCAIKAFRRDLIEQMHLYGEMHRFAAVLAEGLGARSAQVEVNHRPRSSGTSKYGIMRTFKVLLDLMTVWFMRGFETKPIYVFGGAGLGLMGSRLSLAALVLYQKFFHGVWVHRNPVFILSMVTAVMAVQFVGMGLIAEMIVRTYFESRGRPPYAIGRTAGFDRPGPSLADAPWPLTASRSTASSAPSGKREASVG